LIEPALSGSYWEKMELAKEQKIEQLEKILHSRTLQNSENLKAFLRFVVEKTLADEGVQLKEYTIATEVFGRKSDYDPRIDSVVRVQAGRLRTKLQEYYTVEGKNDQIVIDLPKGHYHPVFNCPYAESGLEISPAGARASDGLASNGHPSTTAMQGQPDLEGAPALSRSRAVVLVLAGLVIVLGVAVVGLYSSNRALQRQARNPDPSFNTEDFKAVWSPFVDDPESPLLVLSNPTLFRFLNDADPASLARRALQMTPEQTRSLIDAPEFKGQYSGGNSPRLIPSLGMYTGMGEAVGVYRITDLMRSSNKTILLRQSRHVSAADLKYRNVILLGSIYVNEWSRRLPQVENFVYTFSATIENRDPLPGEEREYKPQFNQQTGEMSVDYAIITVKPNVSGERLRQLGGQNPPPKYYQALLKVEVENGTPTTITLLSLRALPETSK
jgi:hypothetical protein